MEVSKEEIKFVKGQGFLRNRGTSLFSGRVVTAGGVYTAAQLALIAECAARFGNGRVAFTTRLSAEIVGIPYEQIEPARAFLAESGCGLGFGGTGAKIRPITACKGTTCVFGCLDTQALAETLHQQYYIVRADLSLPHKFKIAVGGCPNSCMKPSLNDFGIEGRRVKGEVRLKIYIGGTWGKKTRVGDAMGRLLHEDEVLPALDATLAWYREYGLPGERLGATVDRLGLAALESACGGIFTAG